MKQFDKEFHIKFINSKFSFFCFCRRCLKNVRCLIHHSDIEVDIEVDIELDIEVIKRSQNNEAPLRSFDLFFFILNSF